MTDANNEPAASASVISPEQKRGRRMFLLMFGIFFGPFLIAALAKYYGWFAVSETVNYGTLVKPAVLLSDQTLTVSNKDKNIRLRDKWSLLLFIPDDCDSECLKSVREVEAIHLLLNRDIQRVQLLAVNKNDVEPGLYRNDLKQDKALQAIQQEIANAGQSLSGSYLIDPKGFMVLTYPQVLDGKKLQKDLKRLLKYSRIG